MVITNHVTRHSIRNWADVKTVSENRNSLPEYDPDRCAIVISFERVECQGRYVDQVNIETYATFNMWRLHYNLRKINTGNKNDGKQQHKLS